MSKFSWMNPKLVVRKSIIGMGLGIFTTKKISKDERLAIFGGRIMSLAEEASLDESIKDYAHQIDDEFVMGINNINDIQDVDHFNHSCNPNAGFNGQIFLVAMRDIIEGEEVTFDYAMVLGGDDPYELECLCGSQNCRRLITNRDWKITELQKKYDGYFQYYLQKKISKLI